MFIQEIDGNYLRVHLSYVCFKYFPIFDTVAGCVVRRRWQTPWLWSEARVSAWAPKEEAASIFELTMTYGDFFLVKYKTVLGTRNVQTTRYEGSGIQEVVNDTALSIGGERWADFTYTVDAVNALTHVSGNIGRTLVNFTTPDPRFPASLEVVGTNLTLNCYSGTLITDIGNSMKK